MKTIALIYTFACCGSLAAWAQGAHLSAGDTLAFGFNGVDGCHFTEFFPGSGIAVSFGTDLLGPGDSLRLELFENSLNDVPFATATYSPTTTLTFVDLYGPNTRWRDFQGVIRVSALSGSVDVLGGHFFIALGSGYCDAIVAVPEPRTAVLLGFGLVLSPLIFCVQRMMSRCMPSS